MRTEGPLSTARLKVHHLRAPCARADAPRVLLLGGSNFDLRFKRSFLGTALTDHCHLATYEPRGIGRTEQPSGDWTMQDYAADALAVMDALGWQDAHVIGESFGGMTALHLALMASARLQSLTVSSATAGGATHASYDISQFLNLPRAEAAKQAMFLQDTRNKTLQETDPETFEAALKQRQEFEQQFADPSIASGGYARLLAARAAHDCVAELGRINVPTTVICGRYDLQARPASQQALAEALPDAQLEVFEAGHGVLFASPEATQCAVGHVRAAEEKFERIEKKVI